MLHFQCPRSVVSGVSAVSELAGALRFPLFGFGWAWVLFIRAAFSSMYAPHSEFGSGGSIFADPYGLDVVVGRPFGIVFCLSGGMWSWWDGEG